MNFIVSIFLLVLIIVAFLLITKAKSSKSVKDGTWPFYPRKPLSAPEQVLYFRLCKALPDHMVLAQVGLSHILGVKKGNNFQSWYNRINRMSADFVVCSKDSSVLAVIELDDSSHEKEQRKLADAKKNKALDSAGIRILRWNVKAMPDEIAIKLAFSAQPGTPPDAVKPRR